jgi:mono/diheme cytochrome c family protein
MMRRVLIALGVLLAAAGRRRCLPGRAPNTSRRARRKPGRRPPAEHRARRLPRPRRRLRRLPHGARRPAYAGGRAVDTPFGRVMAPNITPDRDTGIGAWSADDFWNALHNGIGRGGRLLYPAFPYPNYTKVTRDDADALFAYLRSLPPRARRKAARAALPLRQPGGAGGLAPALLQAGRPGSAAARGADWNRGAYLVEGLGHCAACHSPRNGLARAARACAAA